jgi:putative ABC transport system ATP-binding protein
MAVVHFAKKIILSVENIGCRVQQKWLWRDLTFQLYPGDCLGLVGVSGVGKSMLLRTIAGLESLDTGRISFLGKSLDSWSMPDYRAKIIYLHQRPALLEGTVEENLQYVYKLANHRDKVYDRQKILDYLSLLGKSVDFLQLQSSTLSGGESQIVAFLRALQLSPSILLLDEPTASLDGETAHSLEILVQAWLLATSDRAYLWTSHDPNQIARVTNRLITLKRKD